MKIALIGYGKMGRAIERFALERGHEIVCRIDAGEEAKFSTPEFRSADVAIEFTMPAAAVANYRRAMEQGVRLVSGTTGWTDRMPEVAEMAAQLDGTLFWASNFSIGVNLFMKVNSMLARLMEKFPQYTPAMREIHHIHKLDHPSGTAITLAEQIIAANDRIDRWAEPETAAAPSPHTLLIDHEREGEVPGTHIISWTSPVDAITIEHRAFSRDGFALGAVVAAEWLAANPTLRGITGMDTMLAELLA